MGGEVSQTEEGSEPSGQGPQQHSISFYSLEGVTLCPGSIKGHGLGPSGAGFSAYGVLSAVSLSFAMMTVTPHTHPRTWSLLLFPLYK